MFPSPIRTLDSYCNPSQHQSRWLLDGASMDWFPPEKAGILVAESDID